MRLITEAAAEAAERSTQWIAPPASFSCPLLPRRGKWGDAPDFYSVVATAVSSRFTKTFSLRYLQFQGQGGEDSHSPTGYTRC